MKNGKLKIGAFTAALVLTAVLLPVEQPRGSVIPQPEERTSIVIVGDVMQHMPQVRAAATENGGYDFAPQFDSIKRFFEAAGTVIANLETTLADEPPYSGYPAFATPSQLARDLRLSGVDIVSLANNHICDRGANGIRSTIAALDREGIMHTGVFDDPVSAVRDNPLLFVSGGFRFALLAYTYGTNGIPVPEGTIVNLIDTADMRRALDRVPADTDYTIMMIHWGEEYHRTQSPEQEALAGWCRRAGVDFVIGSHPHVTQPFVVERDSVAGVKGVTVFSLGNFISNQNDPYTDLGLMVRLDFDKRPYAPARVAFRADTVRRLRYPKEGRMIYKVVRESGGTAE